MLQRFFVLISLSLFASVVCAENQCRDLFSIVVLRDHEEIKLYPDEFIYRDKIHKFQFEATLYSDGMIFIDVLLRKENGARSEQRGADLYKLMVKHFGLKNIRGFEDSWYGGDNLKEYYSNLNRGMTREEAARHTWSGRQAAKYGFTYVRSVGPIKDDMDFEFSEYVPVVKNHRISRAIKAVFTRPPENEP